jgi:hypothetical protein
MTATYFVILGLAAFRLTRLVIDDTITKPLRSWVFIRWPAQDVEYEAGDKVTGGTFQMAGKLYANEPTWIGDRLATLLGCYACTGFWVAVIVFLAYGLWPITLWLLIPFALSTVVWFLALLQELLE